MSIISLMGFNFVTEEDLKGSRVPKLILQAVMIAFVVIFPFTTNPAAIKWDRDMILTKDQRAAIEVSDFINQERIAGQRFVYAHPYLSEVLDVDHFEEKERLQLSKSAFSLLQPGDIVIWENWFAVVESGISRESLDQNQGLVNIYNSNVWDKDREILYSVYRSK